MSRYFGALLLAVSSACFALQPITIINNSSGTWKLSTDANTWRLSIQQAHSTVQKPARSKEGYFWLHPGERLIFSRPEKDGPCMAEACLFGREGTDPESEWVFNPMVLQFGASSSLKVIFPSDEPGWTPWKVEGNTLTIEADYWDVARAEASEATKPAPRLPDDVAEQRM
jgi:hypothetical protein